MNLFIYIYIKNIGIIVIINLIYGEITKLENNVGGSSISDGVIVL